jgi:beta-N-acetylhexosaminidase
MTFWRGYVLRNKNLVFISFGDPYKLYDLPFIKTYVNAYHPNNYAIKAAVEACFGEIDFMGKSPVDVQKSIEL